MRFLVKATIPLEAGNDLVRDPDMASRMQTILGDLKPEAAYFTASDGQRTMYLIVNMDNAAGIVSVCEPLWLAFEADVDVYPVMTPEDLMGAVPLIEEFAEKY
jgi:hypothetical protein